MSWFNGRYLSKADFNLTQAAEDLCTVIFNVSPQFKQELFHEHESFSPQLSFNVSRYE